jgi:RHS repeat-associated protein
VIIPEYDYRGNAISGYCTTGTLCTQLEWPEQLQSPWDQDPPPSDPVYGGPAAWAGNLIDTHKDGSGYVYMRNRYYDPSSGRFTQEDPIGLAGGLNAYGFANGDPVNYDDPFGLCPCDGDEFARQTGRLLQPIQAPLEIAGTLVTLPLAGGGAAEGISAEVMELGSTLRSGAGGAGLTAAGVAGRVAEATGGVASAMKGGAKVTVNAARDIVARIKATGDVRVSIDGIGSLTREGVVSANRALTHLRNLSSDEITGLVNQARAFLGSPR